MDEGQLLKYLTEHRYKGNLSIPHHSIVLKDPSKYERLDDEETTATFVKEEEKSIVRECMMDNFYSVAPLPKTTRLIDSHPKYPYLNQEIDMLLNSGLSQVFRLKENGNKIIGCTLAACWKTDWSYKAFHVTGRNWFNAAAKIARQS